MSDSTVLCEKSGGVWTITLNRPDAMNSLSVAMLAELGKILEEIRFDSEARCVILTGAGEKAFCAGADLKERAGMTHDQVRRTVASIRKTMDMVEDLPVPTIAAVNGVALGGGTELALACDMRIVAEGALMGLTETSLAIIPGAGGTQRLPRIIGKAKAKELIFTARRIGAAEALSIGLANSVCERAELLAKALGLAEAISQNGPLALRAAKRAIDKGMEMDLASGLAFESTCYETILGTEDRVEGLTAFREKRKPAYKGK
ncbi:enoyl-CoA hydratase [bacterium]|nr:MAG: enoyl-CoA hydratase [bacterium]